MNNAASQLGKIISGEAQEAARQEGHERGDARFGEQPHRSVRLIDKAAKLQSRLDGYNERAKGQKKQPKPPKALINELTQVENRVIALLASNAPMSTYPPSFPQL